MLHNSYVEWEITYRRWQARE